MQNRRKTNTVAGSPGGFSLITPPGLHAAFNAKFGERTPGQIVEARQAVAAPGQRTGGAAPAQTPFGASTANAALPGSQNGNPNIGVPNAEVGISPGQPGQPGQGGKPPVPQPGQPPIPPPQPPVPPPGGPPTPPPPGPNGGFLSRGQPLTNDINKLIENVPGVEQPNSKSYDGTGIPAGWFGMTPMQRAAAGTSGWTDPAAWGTAAPQLAQFGNDAGTPAAAAASGSDKRPESAPVPQAPPANQTQTAGTPATSRTPEQEQQFQQLAKNFYQRHGMVEGEKRFGVIDPAYYQPVTIPADASIGDLGNSQSQFYITNNTARSLAFKMEDLARTLRGIDINSPAFIGDKALVDKYNKYNAIRDLLGLQGVSYDPLFGAPSGGGGGGDTPPPGGGPTPPGDNTTEGGYTPPAALDNFAQIFPGLIRYMTDAKDSGLSAEERSALLETAMSMGLSNQALQRNAAGVGQAQANLDFAQAAPFRSEFEGVLRDVLANPDPTDRTGIKNRAASDTAKSTEQAVQAISGSAARRGLTPGTVSGMAGQITADQGAALARTLGEMDAQAAQAKRAGQMQGLSGISGYGTTFTNPEMQARSALVAAILNTPQAMGSPVQGFASQTQDVLAMEMARKQYADSLHEGGGIGGYLDTIMGGLGGIGGGMQALGGKDASAAGLLKLLGLV